MRIGRTPLIALMAGLILFGWQARAHSTQAGYSAAALYNAANAYARAGEPGMAVLNYERASLLAPNDADIEANLRLVRESSRLPSEPDTSLARAVPRAGPTLLAWSGVMGLLIVGASLLAGQIYPRHRWVGRAAMLSGIAMIGLTAANGLLFWPKLHEAIVIGSNAAVRVSPAPMGDPLFVLTQAQTVKMTAEHAGFVLVQTRAGRTGWVARAALAPIIPSE